MAEVLIGRPNGCACVEGENVLGGKNVVAVRKDGVRALGWV